MQFMKRGCFVIALLASFGTLLAPQAFSQVRYLDGPDSQAQPGVPKGDLIPFTFTSQKYFPGATCHVAVYVPAEYQGDKPACLCLGYDGPGFQVRNVFDNLIFKKEMPVTIGVWVAPSAITLPGHKRPSRYIRSFEYDSMNADYGNYIIHEVMPWLAQQKTRDGKPILISPDPNDHMAMGASTGGIGSFTIAWTHPEFVRRVFSAIGTFVGMRGGDMYPTLIRKTEPKPIRVFLQDGAKDTWNPAFDDWWQQNLSMEESLRFAGYDVNHAWGVLGHEGSTAESVFPEAIKWLWRDYPSPIVAGVSGNSWLKDVLAPGQTWQSLDTLKDAPATLASAPDGSVYYAGPAGLVMKLGDSGKADRYADAGAPVSSMAFGGDGALYAVQPDAQKIIKISSDGKKSVVLSGIRASHVIVDSKGRLYASEPGQHDELPSSIWLVSNGAKTLIDKGIRCATGLLISPDRSRFIVAEAHTRWIFDAMMQDDGTIQYREHFYWLHVDEVTDDGDWPDTSDLAMDTSGDLYAATRMGVQVGDTEGRVAGILTLPGGPVRSLTFGGKAFDTLYVVSGGKIYKRTMAHSTVPNFAVVPATAS